MSNWLTCPVSGRRWASPMRQWLRTCHACGGYIDTRHTAWLEIEGGIAQHWPGTCAVHPVLATISGDQ